MPALVGTVVLSLAAGAHSQQAAPAADAAPKPFQAGTPLSATNEAGVTQTMSSNVKVYGSFRFAESCTFDPARNLIVAMNAGNAEAIEKNDGFVSLINPDGSVHTSKWIGVARDGLTQLGELNESVKRLAHAGQRVSGVVFNGMDLSRRHYGSYGYKYGGYRYTEYKYKDAS